MVELNKSRLDEKTDIPCDSYPFALSGLHLVTLSFGFFNFMQKEEIMT